MMGSHLVGMSEVEGEFREILIAALRRGLESSEKNRLEPERNGRVQSARAAEGDVEAWGLKALNLPVRVVLRERFVEGHADRKNFRAFRKGATSKTFRREIARGSSARRHRKQLRRA